MTEVDKVRRLLDQYERGMMTREELWEFIFLTWAESEREKEGK